MQIVFEFEAPRLQNYGLNSEIRECVICYRVQLTKFLGYLNRISKNNPLIMKTGLWSHKTIYCMSANFQFLAGNLRFLPWTLNPNHPIDDLDLDSKTSNQARVYGLHFGVGSVLSLMQGAINLCCFLYRRRRLCRISWGMEGRFCPAGLVCTLVWEMTCWCRDQ